MRATQIGNICHREGIEPGVRVLAVMLSSREPMVFIFINPTAIFDALVRDLTNAS
jgi:hypothetical protein